VVNGKYFSQENTFSSFDAIARASHVKKCDIVTSQQKVDALQAKLCLTHVLSLLLFA